jgi:hypothetical protein
VSQLDKRGCLIWVSDGKRNSCNFRKKNTVLDPDCAELKLCSNIFWAKILQNSHSAKRAMAMTSEEAARLSRTFPSQLRFGNQSQCISPVVELPFINDFALAGSSNK